MNKGNLSRILKTAGKILMVLSVVFVIYKISKLGFDLSVVGNVPAFLGMSFLALVCNIISTFILALAWGRWIAFFSSSAIKYSDVITIYGKSSIGKYLPGNVMHYVERNLFAAEYGLSQKKIAVSSLMEIGGQVFSAIVISLILLPRSYVIKVIDILNGNYKNIIIALFVIGMLLCIAAAAFVIRKVNIKDVLKGYKASAFVLTLLTAIIGVSASLILNAVGMTSVWMSLKETAPDADSIRQVISSYSAAWVCGFVIPGAPGGIGVREAILTLLLEGVMDGKILVFVIIAHRIITIIGDFAVFAIVTVRKTLTDKRKQIAEKD